ncbi:MAG: hypothetical protein AVDCRST_MAG54-127 [uncultured Actinomycetospora sp.]|uniref:Uncharacterized protein n=1 Tax=uncultured Actinomycetospora sp. TaxID=1135996 RepID=A0A6J4H0J1_9PSEU|nr:MAG: hypothetical protein AVDCRST_MAG54-127 [uncultured Actinomycetospora sp.]
MAPGPGLSRTQVPRPDPALPARRAGRRRTPRAASLSGVRDVNHGPGVLPRALGAQRQQRAPTGSSFVARGAGHGAN